MEEENYTNTETFNNNNLSPENNAQFTSPNNNNNNNNNFDYNSNNANNRINNSNMQNNNENVIWDLELWKKAEQVKFKAYLKQLEYEFINKLTDQFKIKEEERDKEIKNKINEINLLQSKLKKKATELESRENKLSLMEEELKIKINEVARQLANKEEEIVYVKKRFKEEKSAIEKDMLQLQKVLNEKNKEIEKIEANFKNYKKEIDESPVSLLKAELTRKALEIDDHIREKERLDQEKEKLRNQCEKLKLDILKIKKLFEQEKDAMYKQRLDEIEKLKFEIYNQKISNSEMIELQELRHRTKLLIDEETKLANENNGNAYKEKKKDYKIINIKKNSGPKARNNENQFKNEIEKLESERLILLASGAYDEDDPLIQKINLKLNKLIESGFK